MKILLLFQKLCMYASKKVRTAYKVYLSTKRGITISPNTLSFKKLFPSELIGNLQRITLLQCPTQIFRQTREDSLDQCATLNGKFNEVVDALNTTDTREFSVPYVLRYLQNGVQLSNSFYVFIFTLNCAFAILSARWLMFQQRDEQ